MSRGADQNYWDQAELPAVYKHKLLSGYVPIFVGKTGSKTKNVVYVDGYAGRGRYEDGRPGSPLLILQHAADALTHPSDLRYQIYFFEVDLKSFTELQSVVKPFVERGVNAQALAIDVKVGLPDVLRSATELPLFLFLDPCGLGLPYQSLLDLLTVDRAGRWPPTEVLFNFSMQAVSRISGHLNSPHRNDKTLLRLDEALGGDWWRDVVVGRSKEDALLALVQEFETRLQRDANVHVVSVPVRRKPTHKPLYYLVFISRHPLGLWHFADESAKASEAWWAALDESLNREQLSLLPASELHQGTSEALERQAREHIKANIRRLLTTRSSFALVEHTSEVLGDYLGRVRVGSIKSALKELYESGDTSCTVKGDLHRLTVTR